MPDDSGYRPVGIPTLGGDDDHSFRPLAPDAGCHAAPRGTRALVDGIGVYTASPTSPFLTAPPAVTAASGNAKFSVDTPSDVVADELLELAEPLRQQVRALPLRLKLSEEEVSGLVVAMLDVVARHLRIAYAKVRRSQ